MHPLAELPVTTALYASERDGGSDSSALLDAVDVLDLIFDLFGLLGALFD